jgi:hypothetical protein
MITVLSLKHGVGYGTKKSCVLIDQKDDINFTRFHRQRNSVERELGLELTLFFFFEIAMYRFTILIQKFIDLNRNFT